MRSAIYFIFFVFFVGGAYAQDARHGKLRVGDVAEEAKWFLHVNLDQLRGSEIGKQLLTRVDGDAQRKIKAFERMISFNPLEDLDAVTLFGMGADPEQAVAVIRGVFDVEHLSDLAPAADGYKAHTHAGRTIHSWDDEKNLGARIYGCIYSEQLMLLGPNLKLVQQAIGLAGGDVAGMADTAAFDAGSGRTPIFVASADLSILDGIEIESRFVRKIRKMHMVAGEVDGQVFAGATIEAADQRTPKLLGKMLSGVIAFAEAAEQIPAATSDAIRIENSGTQMRIDGTMDLETFAQMAKTLEQASGKL